MTNLANHHHDFPHLAKQSGFCFQLHKGKVNWEEIENLNVNDIVKNRNFQLLEKNLANVINCNLEKEYDLKDIDQNFVKLFKLAQLGVDYLSYCEAYLDKCVVILQEQLIAFQEECESLKYAKEKREEEGSQKKNKTKSYQCEKCDKVFISDVYLKFHDKRRHNTPSTPTRFDGSPKRFTDSAQQTQGEEKWTTSTQTALLSTDRATNTQDDADTTNAQTQDVVKMENLEREILHLKERLRKAENAFTEKAETSAGCPSPFPNPTCHNTMLLLLPSCQAQPGSGYERVTPGFPLSAAEIFQQSSSQVQVTVDQKVKNKPSSEDAVTFNAELEKIINEKENGSPKTGTKSDDGKAGAESHADYKREIKEDLDKRYKGEMECEKENIDPRKGTTTKLSKPLPPPRKSKKVIPERPATENTTKVLFAPKKSAQAESEAEGLSAVTSSSLKRKTGSDVSESLSGLTREQSISNGSLGSRKSAFVEDSSTSFLKAIVRKNSPRFRTFGQNLRRSLTNLRDSVSSAGKDSVKKESVQIPVMSRLNNRLRQMGVDPEWSGIPKKTMKEKLKALKHRRKLLTKENPMYPFIRENIEEAILERLKKNLGRKNAGAKTSAQQVPVSDDQPTTQHPSTTSHVAAQPPPCVMYDIESDSESKSSGPEIESAGRDVPPGKEFDLTVFQIGRGGFKEKDVTARVQELLTDSDIDGDRPDERHHKAPSGLLTDGEDGERGECSEGESHSGGRGALPGADGFDPTLQPDGKKKVCFVADCDDSEEGLSDEDLWSLNSDWEKNVG